ncbi:MAG: MgtC/SapB family protein [Nitrospirae bacterium]|nr:MgtC/SapB family protein [Nitrospirota bacterium]
MITQSEILIRLLLGAVLGGIVGFERQTHGRPAGFRTHLLVCVASVLFMVVSQYYHYLSQIDPSYIRIDPARIAQGAITGVGFIGAGVILKTGITIQGLTTAACIWMVSAIGIAIGSGLYLAGIASTAITYFSLLALRTVEKKMPRITFKSLTIVANEDIDEDIISSTLHKYGSDIAGVDYDRDIEKKELTYHFTIMVTQKTLLRKLLDEVSSLKSVKKVSIGT